MLQRLARRQAASPDACTLTAPLRLPPAPQGRALRIGLSEHPSRCSRSAAQGGARNSAASGPAGCRAWQGDRHRLQQWELSSLRLQEMNPAGDRPSLGAAARPLAAPLGTGRGHTAPPRQHQHLLGGLWGWEG